MGTTAVQKNLVNFAMYISMFPQLIAGPVVRYGQVEKEIGRRELSSENTAIGIQKFITGLGKKVIFANQAGALWEEISAMPPSGNSVLLAWLGAVAYTFQIYFDFSGYSDMAVGLGAMFGFTFPENFDYPYESKSITEFWRRWHISLGTWFREYVYIPLGGNRKGTGRQFINIAIVWLFTGLWHGAYWNFVLWGVYYGILLVLEKLLWKQLFAKLPSIIRHTYTMLAVIFGWSLFAWQDMADSKAFMGAMFFQTEAGFASQQTMYLAYTYFNCCCFFFTNTKKDCNCQVIPRRYNKEGACRHGVCSCCICCLYCNDCKFII